jgi:hypothetical protein
MQLLPVVVAVVDLKHHHTLPVVAVVAVAFAMDPLL